MNKLITTIIVVVAFTLQGNGIGYQLNYELLTNHALRPMAAAVSDSHLVKIMPDGKMLVAKEGELLIDLLERNGLVLETECGKRGTCGKCAVKLNRGRVEVDGEILEIKEHEAAKDMLSCQAKVISPIEITVPFKNRTGLAKILEIDNYDFLKDTKQKTPIIDVGVDKKPVYALAVDIGTTTVAASLVPLAGEPNKDSIYTASSINLQAEYGASVIDRIDHIQNPETKTERLQEMQGLVIGCINNLLQKITEASGINKDSIMAAVFAGNSTMAHMALGVDATGIGQGPEYRMLEAAPSPRRASDLSLNTNPEALVFSVPCVHGFIGGDIIADLLITEMAEKEELTFLIDFGTNGEMVLGNKDKLLSTSCAIGPAFEGMGISCGMKAGEGSIESLKINPNNLEPSFKTIGNKGPLGICGTGLIDLLAELARCGIISNVGRINKDIKNPRIRKAKDMTDSHRNYEYLVWQNQLNPDEHISITEEDIKKIVEAKAAANAGIIMLLKEAGKTEKDLRHVYVAGGFGLSLNIENAVYLGLLPDILLEDGEDRTVDYRFIGNGSLKGAMLIALNKDNYEKAHTLAAAVEYIDLQHESRRELFNDIMFGEAWFLPETPLPKENEVNIFDQQSMAEKYDSWYEKNRFAYESELEALRRVVPSKGKGLEIGVGTGRFSAPLGIKYGIDPSSEVLKLVKTRGTEAFVGRGENLPFNSGEFDYILITTTFCFLDDPEQVITEARRVLKPGGKLIIGLIDRDSPIGKIYQDKREGFYKEATIRSTEETLGWLKSNGFSVDENTICQTIFHLPGEMTKVQQPEPGHGHGVFVVIEAKASSSGKDIPKSGIENIFINAKKVDHIVAQKEISKLNEGNYLFNVLIIDNDMHIEVVPRLPGGEGLSHRDLKHPSLGIGVISGLIDKDTNILLLDQTGLLDLTQKEIELEHDEYIRLARFLIGYGLNRSTRYNRYANMVLSQMGVMDRKGPRTIGELALEELRGKSLHEKDAKRAFFSNKQLSIQAYKIWNQKERFDIRQKDAGKLWLYMYRAYVSEGFVATKNENLSHLEEIVTDTILSTAGIDDESKRFFKGLLTSKSISSDRYTQARAVKLNKKFSALIEKRGLLDDALKIYDVVVDFSTRIHEAAGEADIQFFGTYHGLERTFDPLRDILFSVLGYEDMQERFYSKLDKARKEYQANMRAILFSSKASSSGNEEQEVCQLPEFEFTATTSIEDILNYLKLLQEQLSVLRGRISQESWLGVRILVLEHIGKLQRGLTFLKKAKEHDRMPCMHALNMDACPDAMLAKKAGKSVAEKRKSADHAAVPESQKPPISNIEINNLTALMGTLVSFRQALEGIERINDIGNLSLVLKDLLLVQAGELPQAKSFQHSISFRIIDSAA